MFQTALYVSYIVLEEDISQSRIFVDVSKNMQRFSTNNICGFGCCSNKGFMNFINLLLIQSKQILTINLSNFSICSVSRISRDLRAGLTISGPN